MRFIKKQFSIPRLYFGLILILCSCEDFVDIGAPISELIRETVFIDDATAEAALMDIYAQLRNTSMFNGGLDGCSSLFGHYADELILYNNNLPNLEAFYQHTVIPGNTEISVIWNNSYNLIYAANSIIEGSSASKISVDIRKQLQGEALFIRALVHFYLVNFFGDLPYITSTDYRENSVVSRLAVEDVYTLIIEDLKQAKILLTEEYVTSERIRVNQFTVAAFLARVYAYTEQWHFAETEATEVIDQSIYDLPPLDEVFLKNSPASIWSFHSGTPGYNTIEAQTYIFTIGPPPNTALNPSLVNSFEPGDGRLKEWVGTVTDTGEIWYFAHKYKRNSITDTSEEYSIVFRLAEQYLIRAEARAKQGVNLIGAIADLDAIRARAGIPLLKDTYPGITPPELLEAILHERQVELFTEFGHRWLDLKRTGKAAEVLKNIKPQWNDTDILLPIPEAELLINPNLLPQNPGYN